MRVVSCNTCYVGCSCLYLQTIIFLFTFFLGLSVSFQLKTEFLFPIFLLDFYLRLPAHFEKLFQTCYLIMSSCAKARLCLPLIHIHALLRLQASYSFIFYHTFRRITSNFSDLFYCYCLPFLRRLASFTKCCYDVYVNFRLGPSQSIFF